MSPRYLTCPPSCGCHDAYPVPLQTNPEATAERLRALGTAEAEDWSRVGGRWVDALDVPSAREAAGDV